MSNAMSLKAKIRNIAKQKNIPAQVILQNYMLERQEMAKKAGIPMTNYGIFIYVVQLKII